MNRRVFSAGIVASVAAITMLSVSSCKADKNTIKKGLQLTASTGSRFGLTKWAKTDAASANECAKALSSNIKDVLLPYFQNQASLPTSSEVREFINSSLFKNVKPEIKDAIVAASIALDAVLPVPSSSEYLNSDQVEYIVAFLTGLEDGCKDFLGSKGLKNVWLK